MWGDYSTLGCIPLHILQSPKDIVKLTRYGIWLGPQVPQTLSKPCEAITGPWAPVPAGDYTRFVLVDDAGAQLATGVPTGRGLPRLQEREQNYEILKGGRYATAADAYASA